MHSYNIHKEWEKLLTPDIVALLTQIHEFKGEQNLFIEANRDTLTQLLEIAKIQSTEASNNIEGIYASDDRLKKIVLDKTTPRTRNEQEIAGYRDVLATIHESYEYIPLRPSMILQLHRDLYKFSGSGVGGSYKNADNVIAQEDAEGNRYVRFQPVPAWETPEAVERACNAYNEALQAGVDPLLAIPMFILDFLCIHPFSDGNGRMSRLLTLLLLYRAGYIVGKYISIERVVEQSKETYYETLLQSSAGWHEDENDYAPFVRYTLGTVLAAYREFSTRVQLLTTSGLTKPERIREVIRSSLGKITKAEIMAQCPDISQVTVQRTLLELQKKGEIIKLSGGRYTAYIWNRENN
ncbi:MAG: Fic family protein [Clostridiales bacterium]|nr:Fic family protein [Clostridiales bacterium]